MFVKFKSSCSYRSYGDVMQASYTITKYGEMAMTRDMYLVNPTQHLYSHGMYIHSLAV